ncbi:MAG: Gfo/Idh/MocA family oxidoreductase [Verrucomicrobiia bacterium]|jgi:predicted dehydrogenase
MKSRSLSRRKFLEASAFASAPFILPSGIWSAESKPNDKIAIGFIGMGKQNRGLLNRFMGQESAVAVAVCDVDTNRRNAEKERVDKKYGNTDCAAYSDFREVISRKDIDAICIATPDHWHAVQTIAALDAGKDVYCEKPLTHNIHEALEVMKAVKRNGRVLQTGSMQRSSREFRIACELVRNGVIGKIKRADVNFGGPGVLCDLPEEKMEPGLDWNRWLGPAPERPYNSILSPRGVHNNYPLWRHYREYGGGSVTDWGAHHLDIVQWGLGMDESGPVRALPPKDKTATSGARLIYKGNIPVLHGAGVGVHFFGEDGEVQVTRGRFSVSLGGKEIAGRLDREDKTRNLGKELDKAEAELLKDAKVKLYDSPGHLPDFLNAMRTRKKPITHEGVGAHSAIACHLMNLAYYHGQEIRWNPKKNKFADDSGKAEWLTRDYRGQWKV